MTEDPRIRDRIRAVLSDPMLDEAAMLDQVNAILDSAPPAPAAATWSCARCGGDRWVGWRAGPEHEGWPRKAQCVPCGHVQALPATTTGVDRAEITEAEASEARDG